MRGMHCCMAWLNPDPTTTLTRNPPPKTPQTPQTLSNPPKPPQTPQTPQTPKKPPQTPNKKNPTPQTPPPNRPTTPQPNPTLPPPPFRFASPGVPAANRRGARAPTFSDAADPAFGAWPSLGPSSVGPQPSVLCCFVGLFFGVSVFSEFVFLLMVFPVFLLDVSCFWVFPCLFLDFSLGFVSFFPRRFKLFPLGVLDLFFLGV